MLLVLTVRCVLTEIDKTIICMLDERTRCYYINTTIQHYVVLLHYRPGLTAQNTLFSCSASGTSAQSGHAIYIECRLRKTCL